MIAGVAPHPLWGVWAAFFLIWTTALGDFIEPYESCI